KLERGLQIGGQCGGSQFFLLHDIHVPKLIPYGTFFGYDEFIASFGKAYGLLLGVHHEAEITFELQLFDKAAFFAGAAFVYQTIVEYMEPTAVLKMAIK